MTGKIVCWWRSNSDLTAAAGAAVALKYNNDITYICVVFRLFGKGGPHVITKG
jgi:hypothetical protein